MKPETEDYLAKASLDIQDARRIMALPLARIAARTAYYAAFHAAEALIFERFGKIAKTHAGVHVEFARIVKDMPTANQRHSAFLSQAYMHKQISDYGVGQVTMITDLEALQVIADAEAFVAEVKSWITSE